MIMHPAGRPGRYLSGGILVLGLVCPAAFGQLALYESFHSAVWHQTTASPSFDRSNAGHYFAARITVTDPADATEATMKVGSSVVTLTPVPGSEQQLLGYSSFYGPGNHATFDANFPPGASYDYEITSGSLTGEKGTIVQPDPLPWPDTVPVFADFDNLISPGVDVNNATFSWGGWTAAPSYPSSIFFQIWDGPNSLWIVALPTTDTSYTVPPGVLTAGSMYQAELVFSSRLDSGLGSWQDAGLVEGLAGYDFKTTVDFMAVPEPATFAVVGGSGLVGFALWRKRATRSRGRLAGGACGDRPVA